MTCKTCGREGKCHTCCCVSTDHMWWRQPFNLTECRRCGHKL